MLLQSLNVACGPNIVAGLLRPATEKHLSKRCQLICKWKTFILIVEEKKLFVISSAFLNMKNEQKRRLERQG